MCWLWVFMLNSRSVTSNTLLRFVLSGPGLLRWALQDALGEELRKRDPHFPRDGSLSLFGLLNTLCHSPQMAFQLI